MCFVFFADKLTDFLPFCSYLEERNPVYGDLGKEENKKKVDSEEPTFLCPEQDSNLHDRKATRT